MKRLLIIPALSALLWGCNPRASVKIEPIEVKPIHMTLDVNIKVDRELDKFFDFEQEAPGTTPESKSAAPDVKPGASKENQS